MSPREFFRTLRSTIREYLSKDNATDPAEPFLLGIASLQGYLSLTGIARPESLIAVLDPQWRNLWASFLLFGGLIALLGINWKGEATTGLEFRRVGLCGCMTSSLTYGVVLACVGPKGYLAATLQLGFVLVCLIRTGQITWKIKHVRAQYVAARENGG